MEHETITLGAGRVRASVVPARGAIVSALAIDGREVLYLDEATLADPEKNVRGGIPVLFPFAGRLPGDRLEPDGTTMPQHGFGRRRAWAVTQRGPASVAMTIADDDATRAVFPYAFRCDHVVSAVGDALEIRLVVTNPGDRPLPIAPGWHPYFRCAPADKVAVVGEEPPVAPGTLHDGGEPDVGVPAPESGVAVFAIPGLGRLRMRLSTDLKHLQMWSLPGRPFVCVEPFVGPAGTINTARRVVVPPGGRHETWARLTIEGAR
ncbi:MAG: aldose epimerase [Myxococcales bacterium]|nr:aldose epimerase [Myxococcales bacterium]